MDQYGHFDFNPYTDGPNSLELWIKAERDLFTDVGFTKAAYNNAAVLGAVDQSPVGNNLTGATGPLLLRDCYRNKPGLSFNGSSMQLKSTSPTLAGNSVFTIFIVARPAVVNVLQTMFVFGNSSGGLAYNITSAGQQEAAKMGGSTYGNGTTVLTAGQVYVFQLVYNGLSFVYGLNGAADGSFASASQSFTLNQLYLGAANGSQFFNGVIFEVIEIPALLTTVANRQFINMLLNKFNLSHRGIIYPTDAPYFADNSGIVDVRLPLQSMYDDILTRAIPAHVHYLGGNYLTTRAVLADAAYLTHSGDDQYTTVITNQSNDDVIQIGTLRNSPSSTTHVLTSAYWPNMTTTMDMSQNPVYGLRTNGDSFPSFHSTPFDRGLSGLNNYALMNRFTLDVAIYMNAGWSSSIGAATIKLFGMGSPGSGYVTPFAAIVASTLPLTIRFFLTTSDGVLREFDFPIGSSPATLQRWSIQIDLTQSSVANWVTVWQGTTKVAVNASGGGSYASGLTAIVNEYQQMQLGTDFSAPITDMTICGFKLTGGLLYNPANASLTRYDSATINDAQQFFTVEATPIFSCLLPLNDSGNAYRQIPWSGSAPIGLQLTFAGNSHGTTTIDGLKPGVATTLSGMIGASIMCDSSGVIPINTTIASVNVGARSMTISNAATGTVTGLTMLATDMGAVFGYNGFFSGDQSLTATENVVGCIIRDIQLVGQSGYGKVISHGPTYDVVLNRIFVFGGCWGWGAAGVGVGSTYPVGISDCIFSSASEGMFFNEEGFTWMHRNTIKYWGRIGIRGLYSGCLIRDMILAPGGPGDYVFKQHHSGSGIYDDVIIDFEGGGPSSIFSEVGANQGPTFLTIRNSAFGSVAGTLPRIVLSGPPVLDTATYGPQKFVLEQVAGLFQAQNIQIVNSFVDTTINAGFNQGGWQFDI